MFRYWSRAQAFARALFRPVAATHPPERFHSLDTLRGLAALAVVFSHWHIFGAGEPWREVFFLGYSAGWRAVDLFFVLSGFVFFWLYAQNVAAGRMDARSFFVLRFSRLYPLHVATLVLAAVGHWWYVHLNGHNLYRFVQDNDAYHFVLSLFMIQGGNSFNSPAWSLCAEAFIYALFYVATRWFRIGPLEVALIAFIGLESTHFQAFRHCVGAFFMGGVAYHVYRHCVGVRWIERVLRVVLLVSWALTFASVASGITLNALPWTQGWNTYFAVAFLYPCTVLYLAMAETRLGTLWRRGAWLGDISYSVYLIHLPLILAAACAFPRETFSSPVALCVFLAVTLALGFLSFRYFEVPARAWLRARLLGRRVSAPRSEESPLWAASRV